METFRNKQLGGGGGGDNNLQNIPKMGTFILGVNLMSINGIPMSGASKFYYK